MIITGTITTVLAIGIYFGYQILKARRIKEKEEEISQELEKRNLIPIEKNQFFYKGKIFSIIKGKLYHYSDDKIVEVHSYFYLTLLLNIQDLEEFLLINKIG